MFEFIHLNPSSSHSIHISSYSIDLSPSISILIVDIFLSYHPLVDSTASSIIQSTPSSFSSTPSASYSIACSR